MVLGASTALTEDRGVFQWADTLSTACALRYRLPTELKISRAGTREALWERRAYKQVDSVSLDTILPQTASFAIVECLKLLFL